MVCKINVKRMLLFVSVLFIGYFNQPTPTYASGYLSVGDRGHHGRYTEVMVGSNRYYYDQGVYYTGKPDHYVVVDAPVGAVIYNIPTGYEVVQVEGNPYYRYHDVYYRHGERGYEVVQVDRSHVQERRDNGQDHGQDNGDRNEHRRN